MESETPTPGRVKGSNEKVTDIFPREMPHPAELRQAFADGQDDAPDCDPFGVGDLTPEDLAPAPFPKKIPATSSENLLRRMAAYLHGWCANGIFWVLAPEFKRRFAKRTGYSWDHVHDVFPEFMRYTTEFVFKRARLGRSTCILIHPKNRKNVLTQREARARLVGAIRSMAAKVKGRVGIGLKFLENFAHQTGLAPEHVLRAWQSLRRIDGLSAWWGGRKSGRKFYVEPMRGEKNSSGASAGNAAQVSLPENTGGISPLRGNRSENSDAAASDRSQAGQCGSLRSHSGERGGGTAFGVASPDPITAPSDTSNRATPSSGADDQTAPTCAHPPGGACKPSSDARGSGAPSGEAPENLHRGPAENPQNFRWRSTAEPLQIGNRWISPRKLRGKANFLAFVVLQNFHAEFFRVRFRPAHARNFAEAALRAGFLDSEICAAYRLGLDETQNSAARDWHENIASDGMREPSQAVARAWLRLRADERSDAERWAAIFARPQCPRGDSAAGGLHARSSRAPAGEFRQVGPGLRVRIQKDDASQVAPLPTPAPALVKAHRDEHATVEKYLAVRGMKLLDLLKLPRAEQAEFIRELREWQKRGG
jgi:hypothetical protein